jgi:hypothetical protein
MISTVVGTLLLGWGSTALVVMNLRPLSNLVVAGILTCAMSTVMGIVFARIVSRHGRTKHQRIIKV